MRRRRCLALAFAFCSSVCTAERGYMLMLAYRATHSMAPNIHKLQARVSRNFACFAQCANRPRAGQRAHKTWLYIGFSPEIARDERFRLCTTWARPYADRKYASSSIHPCKATACVRNVRCGWSFQMEAIPNSAGNVLGTNLCTQGASAQHAIEVATLVIHVIVCVDPTVHG